jgi:hypothetical protein
VQRSNRRNPMDQFLLPAAGCEGAPAPGAVGRGISLTYHASHPHISIRSLMKKTSPIAPPSSPWITSANLAPSSQNGMKPSLHDARYPVTTPTPASR